MHTEHLQNVRGVWVLVGWLIAVAVTSLVGLLFAGLGFIAGDTPGGIGWSTVAVIVGFFAGGLFVGIRTVEAPILHGVAIGLTSLVAVAFLNLLVSILFQSLPYPALSAPAAVAFLLMQMAAAVVGAWVGYAFALRGGGHLEL